MSGLYGGLPSARDDSEEAAKAERKDGWVGSGLFAPTTLAAKRAGEGIRQHGHAWQWLSCLEIDLQAEPMILLATATCSSASAACGAARVRWARAWARGPPAGGARPWRWQRAGPGRYCR